MMDWSGAFLEQAKSDYEVFRLLNASRQSLCHRLHYMQMASEKTAKSFLCKKGSQSKPQKSHKVLTQFLHASKGHPFIRERLGFGDNYLAYCTYIESIMDIADKIENLAPSGTKEQPNPEYPWLVDGAVYAPCQYAFDELDKTALIKFQYFLGRLLG